MQLQIFFLILFSINICKSLTQTQAKATIDNSDIEDTPSPEWIKYQQERYKNSDKLRDFVNSSMQPKTSVAVSKIEFNRTEAISTEENLQQKKENNNNNNSKNQQKSSANDFNSGVELPSIQGFIKYIKSFKQTWMKNSLFRLDDKIKMLQQLKDSMLKAIEKQFMALWQDDEDDENHMMANENGEPREEAGNKRNMHLRRKRGIFDESSIYFPPEAALMSINFLTFAVFLIKLVLQVVNIVKTKHYQVSTVTMDTDGIRNG